MIIHQIYYPNIIKLFALFVDNIDFFFVWLQIAPEMNMNNFVNKIQKDPLHEWELQKVQSVSLLIYA